ncbi:MAG: hypothetical protein Pyrs2KO_27190 [Pyruvatibacter sp.]
MAIDDGATSEVFAQGGADGRDLGGFDRRLFHYSARRRYGEHTVWTNSTV